MSENNANLSSQTIITKEGLNDLKKELNILISEKRPEITARIKAARDEGDLSENADYASAREDQAQLESRIQELEIILGKAKVIEDISAKTPTRKKSIGVGSVVSFAYLDDKDKVTDKVLKVKIVGSIESNPFVGHISNECPLARSIMNSNENDVVEVRGVEDPYKIKIISVGTDLN